MGVQDITEKSLEGLPDVFADILTLPMPKGRGFLLPATT